MTTSRSRHSVPAGGGSGVGAGVAAGVGAVRPAGRAGRLALVRTASPAGSREDAAKARVASHTATASSSSEPARRKKRAGFLSRYRAPREGAFLRGPCSPVRFGLSFVLVSHRLSFFGAGCRRHGVRRIVRRHATPERDAWHHTPSSPCSAIVSGVEKGLRSEVRCAIILCADHESGHGF